MTVEAALTAALDPLVSSRVYAVTAADGAAAPYITFQQIGGQPLQYLERALPSKKNGRYQVNVWATTRTEAAALALQIEAAIVLATTFQVEVLGQPSDVDGSLVQLFGLQQDFSIWSDR